jgi:hypothetical protein
MSKSATMGAQSSADNDLTAMADRYKSLPSTERSLMIDMHER